MSNGVPDWALLSRDGLLNNIRPLLRLKVLGERAPAFKWYFHRFDPGSICRFQNRMKFTAPRGARVRSIADLFPPRGQRDSIWRRAFTARPADTTRRSQFRKYLRAGQRVDRVRTLPPVWPSRPLLPEFQRRPRLLRQPGRIQKHFPLLRWLHPSVRH